MLCKDVCLKCLTENTWRGWTKTKEKNWNEKNRVYCTKFDYSSQDDPWINVEEGEPPNVCPYKLEHLVVSEKE